MNTEEIKNLLERYWMCETSAEEEGTLRTFFSQTNVPEELKAYASLFQWQKEQSNVRISGGFDERILNQIGKKTSEKKTISVYLYPTLKIAASLLLILTFVTGLHTQYDQKKQMDEKFSGSYLESENEIQQVTSEVKEVLAVVPDAPQVSDTVDVVSKAREQNYTEE